MKSAAADLRLTREFRLAIPRDPRDPTAPDANRWLSEPVVYAPAIFVNLRLTLSGQPHPQTGYLADIREIDAALRIAIRHCLTPQLPDAPGHWLSALFTAVRETPLPARPSALTCVIAPGLSWSTDEEIHPMIRMTESFEFSASHRLHCSELTDDENQRLFGKCNNPRGHGHNYVLDITIEGEPKTQTGLLMQPGELEAIVKNDVLARFDHRHLNEDCPEFARLNPTVENIARTIHDILAPRLGAPRLANVRVWETPKTWADCGRQDF